ncbi:MAG: hypothetical protein WKG07_24860 [Hymenobacter sp.]
MDGEARPAGSARLPAGQHRVSFALAGISLAPGGADNLEYRYRLRGLADEWSRPSPAGEAQVCGPGAGPLRAGSARCAAPRRARRGARRLRLRLPLPRPGGAPQRR